MDKDIYLIIGASSEIGRSYLKQLEEKGIECTVIATFNSSKQFFEDNKSFSKVKVDAVKCDLSSKEEVSNLIEYIKNKYKSPTKILHLAANKLEYIKFKKLQWNNVLEDLEVQVHSVVEILKVFLPEMVKNKYGKVVFMLSSCTIGVPPKFMSSYIIVKHTLLGLMKSLASEYSGKGICINAVSPAAIETRFWDNIDGRVIDMIAADTSMKRTVKKEEVISCIDFLMSEGANYMNGVNLNISGGDLMQ